MPQFTCYVVGFNTSDSEQSIGGLSLNGRSAGDFLRQASGTAQLDVRLDWSRWSQLSDTPFNNAGVSQNDLPDVMGTVLTAAGSGSDPNLCLLICNQLIESGNQYGAMFDLDEDAGSIGPRQGLALFTTAMRSILPDSGSPEAFSEFAAYIATHELGHVFNLWHMDDNSFMQPNPMPTNNREYAFNDTHATYLALASQTVDIPYVLPGPGREPFGTLAPGYESSDKSAYAGPPPSESDLALKIELSHTKMWSFEPVELDIEISSTSSKTVQIPNEVDPGYDSLQIWITKPDGERFRYRPERRFCSANGLMQIVKKGCYRRDVTVFRHKGRYTFSQPGHYLLEARLRLQSGECLASNVVTCESLPAAHTSDDWRDIARVLQETDARKLLRYKRALPSLTACARLTDLAANHARPETAAMIHYALGKAFLNTSHVVRDKAYSGLMRRRAETHLRQGLKTSCLGQHRTSKAEMLLGNNHS